MPASTNLLLDAIERTLFVYPEVPGLVTDIRVPGVLGRETPVSHPVANLVGCAALDDANADATICAVRDAFAAKKKSFGWITSPPSRPRDLPKRLVESRTCEGRRALRDDPDRSHRADSSQCGGRGAAGQRRRAAPSDTHDSDRLWLAARRRRLVHRSLDCRCRTSPVHDVPRILADYNGPVAFGNVVFIPETSIVLLGGAATVSDLRGRGIYTSLVARRLADAKMAGADAAVIQAVRGTSAPVCAKLGFKEILPLDFYAWVPPGVEMDLHA